MKHIPMKPTVLMMSMALCFAANKSASAATGPGLVLDGATVNVSGDNNPGAKVEGDNGTLQVAASSITSNGAGSHALVVRGANASAQISGSQMHTLGERSHGVALSGAGAAGQISSSTITTQGENSFGVDIGAGAAMQLEAVTISSSGTFSNGLNLRDASSVGVRNSDIGTSGDNAHGIYLLGAGAAGTAQATMEDSSIVTTGDNSIGVNVNRDAAVVLINTQISTAGSNAFGIWVPDANSSLTGQGAIINTTGEGAIGVFAQQGGSVRLDGADITTSGDRAYGLHALNNGNIGVENSTIAFSGLSVGAYAANTAQIDLQNVLIQGTNGGIGLVSSSGSTINAVNTRVEVSGANARGMQVSNGATLNLNGSEVVVAGADSRGMESLAASGVTNHVTLANSSLEAEGSALNVRGGSLQLDVSDSVISGKNLLLVEQRQLGDGSLVDSENIAINVSSSRLSGDINVDALNSRLALDQNSTLNSTITGLQVLGLTDSQWLMTGSSDVGNLDLNNSTVSFAHNGSFNTLTVNQLSGSNSTLVMNTRLGDDSSASDRLVIDGGHASGTTDIIIQNIDGAGARTENGILLVEAINNGTTDPTAFKLGQEIRAGAFDYRLFRSGLAADQADNWYLRSWFEDIGEPGNPGTPGEDEEVRPLPIYGPELSVYGAIMPTASRLGQATLATLHERVGEQENMRETAANGGSKAGNGAWGRLLGQSYKDRYTSIVNPSTSTKVVGFQVGADIYRNQQTDGQRDHVGAYFAVVNASADVSGVVTNADATAYQRRRTGSIDLDAVSAGLYWTHYGRSAWYTDVVLQATSYSGSATTDRAAINVKGSGLVASLEGGYPFQLGNNVSLEPQAQVIAQRVSLDNTADRYSAIDLGASNSVLGRIGVRLQHTSNDGYQFMQPYLRANLWSTLSGAGSTVNYDGTDTIATKADSNWAQVGIGMTAKIDKRTSFYGNLDGMFSVGGKTTRSGVQVAAGMRMNW